MADLRLFQGSFTSGVLSPALWARVDLAKYGSGLKAGTNIFIHAHGGASNRAGLEFCGEVKTSSTRTRTIPFQFSSTQSYTLEFGGGYMRVWKDGGQILTGGGAIYEIATPYAAADVGDLVYIQEADVMYICHISYPVRKLSRFSETNWTLTAVTFTPTTASPTATGAQASYKYSNGSYGTRTFKVTAISSAGGESAASAAVSVIYQYSVLDGRYIRVYWNAVAGATSYKVYRTDASTGLVAQVFAPLVEFPAGDVAGSGEAIPAAPSGTSPPATPTGVVGGLGFGDIQTYVISAVSASTGEEGLPSAEVSTTNDLTYTGNYNTISWAAVSGADYYLVYKEYNGVFGYIGKTSDLSFIDDNIAADTSDGPQTGRNPFSSAGNYPRCATFVEQRLAFASTANDPQAIWLSQSASYENFGYASPAKASDAVTFRIKSKEINEIRSLISAKGLLALSSSSEWSISGGSTSDAISPSAIAIENQGYRGASKVQPLTIGRTVVFAQARGGVVRDFEYQFANDGYDGRDITIMARHYFEGRKIMSWAYSQAPSSLIWVVLDNGQLLSLCYMKEHDVWAWTDHDSSGAVFESVSVITEGENDIPYFVVKRVINGATKRYIERLDPRDFDAIEDAFFVDSGLTYSGAAVTTLSGLGHLEGEQVVALADGNVVRGLTVSGGSVTLPNAATKVHIGLPITAMMQTLDLDLGSVNGLGSVQGRMKSVSEVTLRVERTRGIFVGPYDGDRDSEHLVEYRQRSIEAWNEAIQLYTGDIRITPAWDWNTGGNMVVKQFDPLPMTILAIMPDVTIGR